MKTAYERKKEWEQEVDERAAEAEGCGCLIIIVGVILAFVMLFISYKFNKKYYNYKIPDRQNIETVDTEETISPNCSCNLHSDYIERGK